MKRSNIMRTAAVGAACAAVGAAAGIAGSAASPNHATRAAGDGAHHHRGRRGPMGGPAVHAEAVVLDKAGNGFVTLTTDSGKVKSVSGDQLTITEGVGNVTYKDVTLTIPSGATVRRDFAGAQLSDLKAGDFVRVASSSEATTVFAVDPSTRPPRMHGGRFGGPPPGGPGGSPPPGM